MGACRFPRPRASGASTPTRATPRSLSSAVNVVASAITASSSLFALGSRIAICASNTSRRWRAATSSITSRDCAFAELAAHRVEARRAVLALPRAVGLIANALREVADDDGNDEHDRERHDVTQVRHAERVVRRHEEEIERDHAEHRRRERWAVTESHRDEDDAEQVRHDDVGQELAVDETSFPR